MSSRVESIVSQILMLTPFELAQLRAALAGEDGPDIGVREPRRPVGPLDARGVSLESEIGKEDSR